MSLHGYRQSSSEGHQLWKSLQSTKTFFFRVLELRLLSDLDVLAVFQALQVNYLNDLHHLSHSTRFLHFHALEVVHLNQSENMTIADGQHTSLDYLSSKVWPITYKVRG